ncbi:MAG: class II aldolase/adducin family protein [Clostridia bacterium]|nr:class II aldolase/adducin family protein [Clostridia bacterium]
MDIKLMHPADQLVTIMDRIYHYGMTTTSGGNLSIKDDNGDIWITPGGIDKGTLSRDDIILIKADGTVIGPHKPSSELPFHLDVYKRRPDVRAVLHAHPPALIAFSAVRKLPDISLIPNANIICGKVEYAPYDVPGSKQLGEKIADVFDKGINTVMLENHGVVLAQKDLFAAFMAFETLEYCARLQINALKIGTPHGISEKHMEIAKKKNNVELEEYTAESYSSVEREARSKICELIHRAYDQQLFTATQGTFSERIDGNNFIITPYGVDRKYIEPKDLVRIEDGKKEAGTNPSRSVLLHKHIYETHPEINAIIVAHPPNIMAFAVTDEEFDSKIIPESYIVLRDVKKLPFGSNFMQPKLTAAELTAKTPVVLIENDCIIALGDSLINAFDKLEVLEYSAKAIIETKDLGDIVMINDKEIKELHEAFNLD